MIGNFGRQSISLLLKSVVRNGFSMHFLDSHDMVLRFNNAPIGNYTDDVGSKTTFRVLNSQVN